MSDAASDAYKEEKEEKLFNEIVSLQEKMGQEPITRRQFYSSTRPGRDEFYRKLQKEYLLFEKKNESRKEDNDGELTEHFKTWFPNVDSHD